MDSPSILLVVERALGSTCLECPVAAGLSASRADCGHSRRFRGLYTCSGHRTTLSPGSFDEIVYEATLNVALTAGQGKPTSPLAAHGVGLVPAASADVTLGSQRLRWCPVPFRRPRPAGCGDSVKRVLEEGTSAVI
jgi:hypothetical protein